MVVTLSITEVTTERNPVDTTEEHFWFEHEVIVTTVVLTSVTVVGS